jgi:hypothetical protein
MRVLAVLVLATLAIAGPAQAQKIYKCKNEKGELYYSQSYDPVRCAGGGAQMNNQGVAVRQLDRVKTAEEIAADKVAAAERAEADRIAAEKRQADQVLMMSYANEDELKRVQEQQMQVIDTAVQTAKLQLANQQRTLADLLAVAAESERAKKPVPDNIAASIGTVRKQIEEQNAFITRKDGERVEATAAFEATLARYRELVAEQEARR